MSSWSAEFFFFTKTRYFDISWKKIFQNNLLASSPYKVPQLKSKLVYDNRKFYSFRIPEIMGNSNDKINI